MITKLYNKLNWRTTYWDMVPPESSNYLVVIRNSEKRPRTALLTLCWYKWAVKHKQTKPNLFMTHTITHRDGRFRILIFIKMTYKFGISFCNCSVLSNALGLFVAIGLTTTLSPARSFPSNSETPLIGKVGLTPIITDPETRFDLSWISWRGTETNPHLTPWIRTLAPVYVIFDNGNTLSRSNDWVAPVPRNILILMGGCVDHQK